MKQPTPQKRDLPQRNPPESDDSRATPHATSRDDILDAALARIGKLEIVLAATGGALHDVNNLLTVLSGHLYLLTEAVREQPALLAKARDSRNTAERASTLIRELLSFARDKNESVTVICPAKHALAIEPLLRRAVDARHKLEVLHCKSPWPVACSGTQLESALANLIINANDAMLNAGLIVVGITNDVLSPSEASGLALRAGDFVCLQVTDTGCGIPAALLDKVIQPLYTSKPRGAGSGMGLSMVQRFANAAGGAMRIASVEGQGTTVRVWLPRSEQQPDSTANMTLPLSTLPAGSETVLLVTEDPDVRAAVQQLLDALGYSVIATNDRGAALQLARKHPELALTICDRTEANLGPDRQWLSSLRHVLPHMRHLAILASDARASKTAPDADAHMWRPVGIADLAKSMRAALEAPQCR
jgi:nitrogen-specific signal transduction histidine kinase/CheY-like chemotaxis protein